MTLILNNQDIRDLITIGEVIDVLEFCLQRTCKGHGALRQRSDTIVTSDTAPDAIYSLKSMDGVAPSLGVSDDTLKHIITHPELAKISAE